MPKKQDINQNAQDINDLLDGMYIDTFKTNQTNKSDLSGIKGKAYSSINKITKNNLSKTGKGSFSHILSRMSSSSSTTDNLPKSKEINKLFEDIDHSQLVDSVMSSEEQRNIIAYDDEIDTICEYMPILLDALDAKRDNVLSADQFNKDFLLIKNMTATEDGGIQDRINGMKETYDLLDLTEEIFDDTCKYGESFVYTAPYSEQIRRMLKLKREKTINGNMNEAAIQESYYDANLHGDVITESIKLDSDNGDDIFFNINVNYSGYIDSLVNESEGIQATMEINNKFKSTFIHEAIESNNKSTKKKNKDKKKKDILDKNSSTPTDGLLDTSITRQLNSIPGAIVRKIPRSCIIPLEINKDYCFGYYYFETTETTNAIINTLNSTVLTKNGGMNKTLYNATSGIGHASPYSPDSTKDDLLKKLTAKITKRITPRFIVNNQDLKYEIYNILKYTCGDALSDNMGINITFIPPEYIDHFYWKKDKNGRGVSDLSKSLVPAKLYISLYTSSVIGILTRGFDKRVYYVKNSVDTNISQNLLSAINVIKAGNKGLRDFSFIKNTLNTSGKFNDLVIPTNKNGESPIEFSIMEGQNIDPKESLQEQLEYMAVSPIGVPYEYLMSRKTVDYAIRLTMASGKFLKDTYKRQGSFERQLTPWITKIYNYEFATQDTLEVKLPPPAYLSILNANQMIDNVRTMVESVVDLCNTKSEDELGESTMKQIKKDIAKDYLTGYIDFDRIDDAIRTAEVNNLNVTDEPEDSDDSQGY